MIHEEFLMKEIHLPLLKLRDAINRLKKQVNCQSRRNKWKTANSMQSIKKMILAAYQKVKKNRGSAGIDGIDFAKYEENLKGNLYKLWNRMSSSSYVPKPVMAVEIPKKSGSIWVLGIPTFADRVAQMAAKMYIEPMLESLFHEDSYG